MDPSALSPVDAAGPAAEAGEVDRRLLEASSSGQTDLVLQLLEEDGGHRLHSFKDQVRRVSTFDLPPSWKRV